MVTCAVTDHVRKLLFMHRETPSPRRKVGLKHIISGKWLTANVALYDSYTAKKCSMRIASWIVVSLTSC
jgi:hypothetical protein